MNTNSWAIDIIWRLENSDCVTARIDLSSISNWFFFLWLWLWLLLLSISAKEGLAAAFNHLLVSFLFIFQNDNDLIDNDNAGQSPAAQAVVLTLTLTYYLLNTVPSYVLLYVFVSQFFLTYTPPHSCLVSHRARARTAKVSAISLFPTMIPVPTSFTGIKRYHSCRRKGSLLQ